MHVREYNLKTSKKYLVSLIVLLIGTAFVLAGLPWPLPFKSLALVLLLVYGWYLLRGERTILSFKKLDDGAWQIKTSKQETQAVLLGDSTVTRFVSILRFRVPDKRRPLSCVIFNDALDKDGYHALLMQVKS